MVVAAPFLGVAVLWPVTPDAGSAEQLIRTRLAAHGAVELTSLPHPDRVAQALLATEDSRFFWTPGVDPISVVRVGVASMTSSTDTGGATLEQQLAKNLFVPQDAGVAAKVQESEIALKLDLRNSKDEILRMYLAEVYFGHGFFGLPAAAAGYFGVTPSELTWAQASMLAGLVQAPSAYDPVLHLSAARLRQRHVLDRLVATHVLTVEQASTAFEAPLHLV
jgi:membrane peptidoglycan carboxypeptidase